MGKKTAEEKILIKAYEIAKDTGDIYSEIEIDLLSLKMNIHQKKLANILKQLSRSGFLRRGDGFITLTEKSISLIKDIMR